ncbi:MAG: hypothetical protein IJ799_01330 [Bacteroidales bacterium]|nr:hypothetical protein [Bacteroidales bacterium]
MRLLLALLISAAGTLPGPQSLPSSFDVKVRCESHVQGVAIDTAARCFYLSFTTSLLKTDYEGNVLARIDSINGHLGALTFDGRSRKLYASLECKDDAVGQGIAKKLGRQAFTQEDSKFYIAVVNVDRMEESAMERYEVEDACRDYRARYGCSGIDGVTIAPRIGRRNGRPRLYVAYGIYGDPARNDNDNQVLLEYKLSRLKRGVKAPKRSAKYFIFTGNTNWGVQNLCYDAPTGCIYMATYGSSKPEFGEFNLFAVPVRQKPVRKAPEGLDEKQECLETTARKWNFKDASTGVCSLGDGTWLVATPLKLPGGGQTATIRRVPCPGTDGK